MRATKGSEMVGISTPEAEPTGDGGQRDMLPVEGAAKRLGLSRAKTYQLIADGHLPGVRYPGCRSVRVDPADIDRLIADSK